MQQKSNDNPTFGVGVWVLLLLCATVVVFTFACGAAYTGIQQARLSAARASLGHIESVFQMAEMKAEDQGLAAPEGSYENLLKSYDETGSATLPEYEKYVLSAMLEAFGAGRDFDFAVERYQEGTGMRTTIYYFPVRGRTSIGRDQHYILSNGQMLY